MINLTGKYSLKTRLGLLYALLLIVSVGMMGYFSYWNIWQLFTKNEISHLRAVAKPVIAQWIKTEQPVNATGSSFVNFTAQKALMLAHQLTSRHAVAVVFNDSGKILADGKQLPEEPSAPHSNAAMIKKALSGNNEVTYWSRVDKKPVLVVLIPLRPNPESHRVFGVVQISTPFSGMKHILYHYGIMQWTAVVLIVILGILFGLRLIGWSLKDLDRLTVTCGEIAKGDFTQRASMSNRKDEIGQLAVSFNVMVDKLEGVFLSQKHFVANAAHELLTPLTGLRGSLEVLLRGGSDDPEVQNRMTKGMYKEVNHLIRVCDRLLGLSRLENASHIIKQPIVLSDFFSAFQKQALYFMQNHPLVIDNGPSVTVMADRDLLEQILFNLLSNAIRHSPVNKPVTIGWRLLSQFVEIRVSDKGEGMEKEIRDHAFEPFFSGQSRFSAKKGTGLGLTLTKLMTAAQGGTIRLESFPGKGTTVFFTLTF